MEIKIHTKHYGEVVFLIDDEDSWIKNYKLTAAYLPGKKSFRLMTGNTAIARIIMKCPKGLIVINDNGNTLDLRKKNLKNCTWKEVGRYYPRKG